MSTREEVYKAVDSERDYQDLKWGIPHERTPTEFLVYIQDYLTQAFNQATREPDEKKLRVSKNTLDTIRKVTALGVACLEQHGAPLRTS